MPQSMRSLQAALERASPADRDKVATNIRGLQVWDPAVRDFDGILLW